MNLINKFIAIAVAGVILLLVLCSQQKEPVEKKVKRIRLRDGTEYLIKTDLNDEDTCRQKQKKELDSMIVQLKQMNAKVDSLVKEKKKKDPDR